MDLLRFSTAGSVDDGKSTLIGRLLYDAKAIFEDQLDAVTRASRNQGAPDLALLTDGLRAEREQGITIDVAYRYFATPRRKFIIADTPGHEQYTRNMATGASTADATIILVDARKGLLPQSRRHACIARLLGIPHLILAVNKMDCVDYDLAVFERIRAGFDAFLGRMGARGIAIPVSALRGDNIVERSGAMPWYEGPALLELLEGLTPRDDADAPFRFPVQLALRPDSSFRGYAGQIAAGAVRVGEEVKVLPSGRATRVRALFNGGEPIAEAFAPMSIVMQLADEIDVARGDLIVAAGAEASVAQEFEASLVWMHDRPLAPDRPYLVKLASRTLRAQFEPEMRRLCVETLEESPAEGLGLNEIGRVRLCATAPLAFDPYETSRRTGAFIVIDPESNLTVGAGMIAA